MAEKQIRDPRYRRYEAIAEKLSEKSIR